MKYLFSIVFAGLFCLCRSQPGINIGNPTGTGTRQALLDLLKNLLSQTVPKADPGPSPQFLQPVPFQPVHPPSLPNYPPPPPAPYMPPPPAANGGVFMDLPQTGGHYPGAPMMMRSYHYCPPGPTTADHCKEQKLLEALYNPDGTSRYNWVPPMNPWDRSIPDTVKDTARNILMMKVNSRTNRHMTPKEMELMSILGDPPGQL